MGIAIACSGCGQALQVSDDDVRPEIECLWCGRKTVIARPAVSEVNTPPTASEVQAPNLSLDESPLRSAVPMATGASILPSDDLPLAPVERGEPPRQATAPVPAPAEPAPLARPWYEQKPFDLQPLDQAVRAPTPPAAVPPPLARVVDDDDDDDGQPYEFDGRQDRPCPECGKFVAFDAGLCLSCGYDFKAGKRVKKTYQPISRNWESGWPLATRKRLFLIGQAIALPMSLLGAFSLGSPWGFFAPWGLFTAMTIYLLGTFDRVELTRNKKGKVTLKQTWWVFFQQRPTHTIALADYDGVTFGKAYRADFWDWMVTVVWFGCGGLWGVFITPPLFGLGLLMAILWWYYFVNKETYYVALTKDHGHPALNLYRGWSDAQARDMHDTIKDIAFSPFL